jgi:phosphoglycerol transferase MdoB-like AlkP superfamily enzyme
VTATQKGASAAALTTIALSLLLLQDFHLLGRLGLRWFAIPIAIIPCVAWYLVLRFCLGRFSSVFLVTVISFLLTYVNALKMRNTTQPVVWVDLFSPTNWTIWRGYVELPPRIFLIALVVVAGALWVLRWALPKLPPAEDSWRRRLSRLAMALVLVLLLGYPHYRDHSRFGWIGASLESRLAAVGVSYVVWDWPLNVRRNGLFVHLFQTSEINLPTARDEEEERRNDAFAVPMRGPVEEPRNIVVVLCEACWGDERNFRSEFAPMREVGFEEFTAVAPEFGGGTVNSAFELLTGLPARQVLGGIVYQEYADLMSQDVEALPRLLSAHGYRAYELHNNYRSFWRRDTVSPKLGFHRFISLEDMRVERTGRHIRDEVLYEEALEIIRSGDRNFIFITTMFTHGGYERRGDLGEGDYSTRLRASIRAIADFKVRASAVSPDLLLFVVGDHKPALLQFFHQRGVLLDSDFSSIGDSEQQFMISAAANKRRLGLVPAFLYHPARDPVLAAVAEADGQRLHCVTGALAGRFFSVQMSSLKYASRNGYCTPIRKPADPPEMELYPEWLYRKMLFGP